MLIADGAHSVSGWFHWFLLATWHFTCVKLGEVNSENRGRLFLDCALHKIDCVRLVLTWHLQCHVTAKCKLAQSPRCKVVEQRDIGAINPRRMVCCFINKSQQPTTNNLLRNARVNVLKHGRKKKPAFRRACAGLVQRIVLHTISREGWAALSCLIMRNAHQIVQSRLNPWWCNAYQNPKRSMFVLTVKMLCILFSNVRENPELALRASG